MEKYSPKHSDFLERNKRKISTTLIGVAIFGTGAVIDCAAQNDYGIGDIITVSPNKSINCEQAPRELKYDNKFPPAQYYVDRNTVGKVAANSDGLYRGQRDVRFNGPVRDIETHKLVTTNPGCWLPIEDVTIRKNK